MEICVSNEDAKIFLHKKSKNKMPDENQGYHDLSHLQKRNF